MERIKQSSLSSPVCIGKYWTLFRSNPRCIILGRGVSLGRLYKSLDTGLNTRSVISTHAIFQVQGCALALEEWINTSDLVAHKSVSFNIDFPIHRLRGCFDLDVDDSYPAVGALPNVRPRRKTRLQQDHSGFVRRRYAQRLGNRIRPRCTLASRISIRLRVGWRSICSLAHGTSVRLCDRLRFTRPSNSYPC